MRLNRVHYYNNENILSKSAYLVFLLHRLKLNLDRIELILNEYKYTYNKKGGFLHGIDANPNAMGMDGIEVKR